MKKKSQKKLFAGKRRYFLSLSVALVMIFVLITFICLSSTEKKDGLWLGVIVLLMAWFFVGRGYPSFVKIEGKTISHKDFIFTKYSKRIVREQKIRGLRNMNKHRGGPHMRGLIAWFALNKILRDIFENEN